MIKMASKDPQPDQPPYRQIRALFDDETITVYQAYSAEIAIPAVEQQKLNASPAFSLTRMTWIKPSWAWMLYRSGYSYKDARQTHILALKLTHASFKNLLRRAVLSHSSGLDSCKNAKNEGRAKPASVRVQWDPERTVRLERLDYRSIQIGVPGALVPDLVEGIVEIEDVTGKARELKRTLDEDVEEKAGVLDLVEKGLVPVEKEFTVDKELRQILGMIATEGLDGT